MDQPGAGPLGKGRWINGYHGFAASQAMPAGEGEALGNAHVEMAFGNCLEPVSLGPSHMAGVMATRRSSASPCPAATGRRPPVCGGTCTGQGRRFASTPTSDLELAHAVVVKAGVRFGLGIAMAFWVTILRELGPLELADVGQGRDEGIQVVPVDGLGG